MHPKVDDFLRKAQRWGEEMSELRNLLLAVDLTEDFKWGVPCYTLQNRNVVLIHGFKEYCALLFFKGALLKDDHNLLIRQTENVQSSRQVRFTNVQQIIKLKPVLQAYIHEAIAVEKAGLKVQFKKPTEFIVPEEFQTTLAENPTLKKAFEALTPGRQRGYILHFAQPKQSKTRVARIEKCTQPILEGKGLNDQ